MPPLYQGPHTASSSLTTGTCVYICTYACVCLCVGYIHPYVWLKAHVWHVCINQRANLSVVLCVLSCFRQDFSAGIPKRTAGNEVYSLLGSFLCPFPISLRSTRIMGACTMFPAFTCVQRIWTQVFIGFCIWRNFTCWDTFSAQTYNIKTNFKTVFHCWCSASFCSSIGTWKLSPVL